MSDLLTRMIDIASRVSVPHVRLPAEFMTEDEEPKDFVGEDYRISTPVGFIDDRLRRPDGIVEYSPRRFKPNMKGGGTQVDEDYPQSLAASGWPEVQESNVPRQARGQKADTITEAHDERTSFEIGKTTFNEKTEPTTQPPNPYNARYPYNHVRLSESGHLYETDDTPNAERIKEAHRTGTYYEIAPDGSRVTKVVGDDFTVVVGDGRVNIQGAAIVTIDGDCNLYTKGNFNHHGGGDYNLIVEGKKTERVKDTVVHDYHSDTTLMVGRSIDPLSIGVGNDGGNYKVDVQGDYKFDTRGNALETFGRAESTLPVSAIRTVFGSQQNQTLSTLLDPLALQSFRYDQVDGAHVDVVGGVRSTVILGDHSHTVEGSQINTILLTQDKDRIRVVSNHPIQNKGFLTHLHEAGSYLDHSEHPVTLISGPVSAESPPIP